MAARPAAPAPTFTACPACGIGVHSHAGGHGCLARRLKDAGVGVRPPDREPFRLLVAGSRLWRQRGGIYAALDRILAEHPEGLVVIHGAAPGADSIAEAWAQERGIVSVAFPADWDRQGRAAGPLRNRAMIAEGHPDAVAAFPLPGSVGTEDTIALAREAGIPVIVHPPAGGRE